VLADRLILKFAVLVPLCCFSLFSIFMLARMQLQVAAAVASQTAASHDRDTLPQTGTSAASLIGMGLASILAALGLTDRKRKH
jgi:LPXTG-motif cell wall-anchored protein